MSVPYWGAPHDARRNAGGRSVNTRMIIPPGTKLLGDAAGDVIVGGDGVVIPVQVGPGWGTVNLEMVEVERGTVQLYWSAEGAISVQLLQDGEPTTVTGFTTIISGLAPCTRYTFGLLATYDNGSTKQVVPKIYQYGLTEIMYVDPEPTPIIVALEAMDAMDAWYWYGG